jgi:hypothetical protein
MSRVVAARFAVPFYLRLPLGLFAAWEPETGVCAILNFRRLGDLSFGGTSSLVSENSLIDSYEPRPFETPEHQILMTCVLANGSEIPTLRISTGAGPSFTELRSYSELVVFFVLDSPVPELNQLTSRVEAAANNLIDIYRAATQDPFVRRVDFELDMFIVAFSFGVVPASLAGRSPFVPGPIAGSDIHPGCGWIAAFPLRAAASLRSGLHCANRPEGEKHHVAVLEAETAVEVFVARRLLQLAAAAGSSEADVIQRMENPRDLGLLKARIRMLDDLIVSYRQGKKLAVADRFVASAAYRDWEENLYRLRNRITHAGLRDVTFDMAKAAVGAGK